MTLLLTNKDVLSALDPAACIQALATAYADYARGDAVNRPRSMSYTPLGGGHWYSLKTMDGSYPRKRVHALRIGSDHTYEYFSKGGLRREKMAAAGGGRFVGLVLLFDIDRLEPLAIIQDGELQRWLVGCTSALVTQLCASAISGTVGLIGAGWQAETQLLALSTVRQLKHIRVYDTDELRVKDFCKRLSAKVGVSIEITHSAAEAVEGAEIWMLATNARDPVIDGAWLVPGCHVSSIAPREVDSLTLRRATKIIVRDRTPASSHYPDGEGPYEAHLNSLLDDDAQSKIIDLGQLVETGFVRASDDITVFTRTAGTSGLGFAFAAVSQQVYQRAVEHGLGRQLPTEWFTETAKP